MCYKNNKPIRHTIFNFNKIVSDLDIHANTPSSYDLPYNYFVKILNLYTRQPVMLSLQI